MAELETSLPPLALLDALQQQERDQGRIKLRHWGERCIDLDILLYDDLQLNSERLTVPHCELKTAASSSSLYWNCAPTILPDGMPLKDVQPEFIGELRRIN